MDEEAERTVAGCVADNIHASLLNHQRLGATDFYVPACRQIFEAAESLGWAMPFAERVSEIAGEAKVDAVEVWAMVRTRGVMHDSSGSFARRVLDASRRRRVMAVAEAVYVALGEGGTLPDAVEALESLLGEVRGGEGPAAACCDDVSHKFKPVSA